MGVDGLLVFDLDLVGLEAAVLDVHDDRRARDLCDPLGAAEIELHPSAVRSKSCLLLSGKRRKKEAHEHAPIMVASGTRRRCASG